MKPQDEPKSADEGAYVASVRRATLWLGFLYWFVEFLISSILWGILGIDPIMSAPGKLLLMICGMTLSYGIAAAMFSVRYQHIAIKIVVGFATSLVAAFANTGVDFMLYLLILRPDPITVDWTSIGYTLVYSMATFVGGRSSSSHCSTVSSCANASAAWRSRAKRHSPRKCGRCATRSIRISCSTR